MSVLTRSIEEISAAHAQLPALCNVFGVVTAPPHREENARWVFEMEGMSGRGRVLVAIHDVPPQSLNLGYAKTDQSLVQMFADSELRKGFAVGASVLAQGVPKWSADRGLWLNVQVVAMIQPERTFGRTQVEFASRCDRKTYLTITKGANRGESGSLHYHSVLGNVVHAMFSSWATDGFPASGEIPVEGKPLHDLFFLGLRAAEDPGTVWREAERLRVHVKSSPQLSSLLRMGNWIAESSLLNEGVVVSPDLFREGCIAELKNVSKGSVNDDLAKHRRQVESYLAWAMVIFGVPVVEKWQGFIARLHPSFPEDERITEVRAGADALGRRLLNRHRLVSLTSGSWLPAPGSDCEFCKYADRPDAAQEGALLAPACSFYCQTERSWKCLEVNAGKPCPLYSRCDQRDRWYDFRDLDRFNRLRGTLLREEAERDVVASVVHAVVASDDLASKCVVLGGFRVIEARHGVLKVAIPDWATGFEWCSPGDEYDVVLDGAVVGVVEFRKRKGPQLLFSAGARAWPRVSGGEAIAFRPVVGWDSEPRRLLAFFDRVQRSNRTLWARDGETQGPPRIVSRHQELDALSGTAALGLVDVVGHSEARRTLTSVLEAIVRSTQGRVMVAGAEGIGQPDSADAVWLDSVGLAGLLEESEGGLPGRLSAAIAKANASRQWWIPLAELEDDRIGGIVERNGRVSALVIVQAERVPLPLVAKCFEYAERVVLIGQSRAAGPWAESPEARASEAFQNAFAYLMAGGVHHLPRSVTTIDMVQLPPRAVVQGGGNIGLPRGAQQIPVEWYRTRGGVPEMGTSQRAVSLRAEVEPTSNVDRVRLIHASVEPSERISASALAGLLRHIPAARIEALSSQDSGSIDTSLIGYALKLNAVDPRIRTPGLRHEVRIDVPHSAFRFIQEQCIVNVPEADELVEYVRSRGGVQFVVTSPFRGHCVELAKRLSSAGAMNAKVVPLAQLGRRSMAPGSALLVSWAAGEAAPVFPSPIDDMGRLIEFFCGEWAKVVFFASAAAREHHPVLNRLLPQDPVSK